MNNIIRVTIVTAFIVVNLGLPSSVFSKTQSLKSKFFVNDETAKAIFSGTGYNINNYTLICGYTPGNSDEFGFKLLNAIKQLGYLNVMMCSPGDNVALKILNQYQAFNGLAESEIVDKKTIMKLDHQLADIESRDSSGASFACFSYLKDAPPKDASKEHLAYVVQTAMNAFPTNLRIKSSECIIGQSFPVSKAGDGKMCQPGYWTEYDDNCQLKSSFAVYNLQSDDDYTLTVNTLHEHAHLIDANAPRGRQVGGLDTTEFYKFSYDTNDCIMTAGWRYCKPLIDMNDKTQLISHFFSYAPGWQSGFQPDYWTPYEDFAVSIEMFVMHGKVFRDYAKDKPVLLQKYNWIKKYVFDNAAFETGDPDYNTYAPDLYDIGYGLVSAGGLGELRPDYVYDYQILKSSEIKPKFYSR